MCKDFTDAMERAKDNLSKLGKSISGLKVPCRYKGAFMFIADLRGFRFTEHTLDEMEVIGKTDSDVLIHLIDGKSFGIGVPYMLATYLDNDKARAMVLEILKEKKQRITEKNVLMAIITVKSRLGS